MYVDHIYKILSQQPLDQCLTKQLGTLAISKTAPGHLNTLTNFITNSFLRCIHAIFSTDCVLYVNVYIFHSILQRSSLASLVVRILGFHCCALGSIPGWGTEILQAEWPKNTKILFDLLYFFFSFWLCRILGHARYSSLTRDGTQAPCIGRLESSHRTTREFPQLGCLTQVWTWCLSGVNTDSLHDSSGLSVPRRGMWMLFFFLSPEPGKGMMSSYWSTNLKPAMFKGRRTGLHFSVGGVSKRPFFSDLVHSGVTYIWNKWLWMCNRGLELTRSVCTSYLPSLGKERDCYIESHQLFFFFFF